MEILVTGGTGFIGSHLCKELLDRNHQVTAMARNPDPADVPDGVETAMGDVTAYESIIDAFRGKDAVINLVSQSPLTTPSGGEEMHQLVHRGGTQNCISAAKEHDVRRFLQVSGLGADSAGPTHFIRAKGHAEELLRESELDWTIFRPSVVFGEQSEFLEFTRKLTPPYLAALPGGGKSRFQPIYVGDFVQIMADSLEDETHIGETYELGGPEILTLAAVARRIRNARGQSVRIIPIPMFLAGIGLRIGGAIPGFPMGTDQYRSLKFDNIPEGNDIDAFELTESDLTTLDEYLGLSD